MTRLDPWRRVGDLRPSQLLHTFGVGAIVDLPNISAMVLGLDDWTEIQLQEVTEERLLSAVQKMLGPQVAALRPPPPAPEMGERDGTGMAQVGVPVAPFPRWLLCSYCRLLAPIRSGLFQFRGNQFRTDLTRFRHEQCRARSPQVALPARFVLACENGHLDDFPWVEYVHRGVRGCPGPLRLYEQGLTGEASDVRVYCEGCKQGRSMALAFGDRADPMLAECRGRRPHLRDFEERVCPERSRTILLGASNSWFSLVMTALSIPQVHDPLEQLVEQHWPLFKEAEDVSELRVLRRLGHLQPFGSAGDTEIWAAAERYRAAGSTDDDEQLKPPEWRAFVHPESVPRSDDLQLRAVSAPPAFARQIERVVLVERIREVKALVGFTRIQSAGDFDELGEVPPNRVAALSRRNPRWVPAVEVHGEGIFIQFAQAGVQEWVAAGGHLLDERRAAFERGHTQWRLRRGLGGGVTMPGLPFVLMHSFAHALMRQLAIECGYSLASIRERIYYLPPEADHGPMAGLLIYTAAPDSEGTLGGLVSLGEPEELGRHLVTALERIRLCSSDPLCSERQPDLDGVALHGAACHACLFIPETSCERGNRYLDRSLLIETLGTAHLPYFARLDD